MQSSPSDPKLDSKSYHKSRYDGDMRRYLCLTSNVPEQNQQITSPEADHQTQRQASKQNAIGLPMEQA